MKVYLALILASHATLSGSFPGSGKATLCQLCRIHIAQELSEGHVPDTARDPGGGRAKADHRKQGGNGQSVSAFTLAGSRLGACTPEPAAPLLQVFPQAKHMASWNVQEK